jgi:hypothetical protein
MLNQQPPTLHTSLFILAIIFIRKTMPLVWKDRHGCYHHFINENIHAISHFLAPLFALWD